MAVQPTQWWQRLGERLFGDVIQARVQEAVAAEDSGYRQVSGATETRDDPLWDQQRLLREVYEAYVTNPLAYTVIDVQANFVLGGGVRIACASPAVQKAVDAFWQHPDNAMDTRVYSLYTELALYGEQFVRVFTDPLTGEVRLRQLDPLLIDQIETATEDIEQVLRYRVRGVGQDPGYWIAAAEMEHFTINRVSNALRGRSDLAPLLPWLQRYRDWLVDRARINRLKGSFIYDVTVRGATRNDLLAKMAAYAQPPAPGTVVFHNEAETWQPVQPSIGADDVAADGRALKLMIAAGAGLPEHYLAEGGHVNRATAAEMGLPTLRRFQRRQELFGRYLRRLVARAIQAKQDAGALAMDVDAAFRVVFQEVQPDIAHVAGPHAESFARSLQLARAEGWLAADDAARLFRRFLADEE